jgi:CRISPR-associated exonuclease Cas4
MEPVLLPVILVLLGLCLFVVGIRQRAGFPQGRIIYLDSRMLTRTPDNLFDPELGLAGRPDYVIQSWRGTIPVEVKSSPTPDQPYAGHTLQLAAYCHLVDVVYGQRPAYGVIRYRDQSFRVDYTHRLRRKLFHTLDAMRRLIDSSPDRSHTLPSRCRSCGYQTACDQSLG